MIYLFIHQNFPGQYLHLVRYLAANPMNEIYFISQPNNNEIAGVKKLIYQKDSMGGQNCHPLTASIDREVRNGVAVANICRTLKDGGVYPDIIIGHSGWGETLFIKDVYPDIPVLADFEFYFNAQGADVGFDPEYESIFSAPSSLRIRNATPLIAFQSADWGHTPMHWQHSLFPKEMQKKITVLHEGVDTDIVKPNLNATLTIPDQGLTFTKNDNILTYVARNLEPYRGFHIFMRALPSILRKHKNLRVLIIGGNGVSYGLPAAPGSSYKEQMLNELGDLIDHTRVHFLGQISYQTYLKVLQISSAHVYLTYPFVLSWSFIEALSSGCIIIGSSTPPVLEVLSDGVNGLLVDFFSPEQISERVDEALNNKKRMKMIKENARETAINQFDLNKVIIPAWMNLIDKIIHNKRSPYV